MSASTIVLDLKRNRYFAVGVQETRALFTFALNWSEATACAGTKRDAESIEPMAPEDAVSIAEALVKIGLLSRDRPTETFTSCDTIDLCCTLSGVGYEQNPAASLRCGHIIAFLRACSWASRAVRSKSLYSIVEEVSRNKRRVGERFDDRAIELACIFRRLRSYTFSSRDRCLFHALALVDFLGRYQVFPTWVIGVRSQPWAAHSWVQQGPLILDGSPEQVCEYTPILSV
jgi:hypothetical protein